MQALALRKLVKHGALSKQQGAASRRLHRTLSTRLLARLARSSAMKVTVALRCASVLRPSLPTTTTWGGEEACLWPAV